MSKKKPAPSKSKRVRGEKSPSPCFCGGAPLMMTAPFIPGNTTSYHIQCGACYWALQYHDAVLEFDSYQAAINAWEAAVSGERVYG